MLPALLQNHHRILHFLTEILQASPLTFLIEGPWLSNMRMLVTADPANAQHLLSKNFGNYPKGSKFTEIFEPLGDGIFNSDGELWQYHRNMAQTFFSHPRFQPFFLERIWKKIESGLFPVLDHMSKRGLEIDLQDLFERFTFDITCTVILGHDPKSLCISLPDQPFCKALHYAEDAMLHRHIVPRCVWKFQRWLGVGKERKLRECEKLADDLILDCISKKKQETCKKSSSYKENKAENVWKLDITKYYMDDKRASSETESHTDKFLRDVALNYLLAGRDTTSAALSWFFYLLLKNPHVISGIREELDTIMVQSDYVQDHNEEDKTKGQHWYNHFSKNFTKLSDKLIYLHGAVCEAIRLYPPVPFNHKAPLEPDILPSGHRVDSSMQIILHIYAMGRMKSIWGEDCHEFKPERWISNKGSIKHEPSYKFLAFNAGPRTCIGKHMSLIQMKAVAIAIISNYDIQPIEGHPVVPDSSVVLRMKHGFKVKVLASQQ